MCQRIVISLYRSFLDEADNDTNLVLGELSERSVTGPFFAFDPSRIEPAFSKARYLEIVWDSFTCFAVLQALNNQDMPHHFYQMSAAQVGGETNAYHRPLARISPQKRHRGTYARTVVI